jgi:hypothetical protein
VRTHIKKNGPALRMTRAGAIAILLLTSVSGCSLISLKTPERPLSDRDLNARILTREYSAHFVAAVSECADGIAAKETDPTVRLNALRWKIGAAAESRRAATQMAPLMGLLDTWALAVQMNAFLASGGAGSSVFGSRQATAQAVASKLSDSVGQLAAKLMTPAELTRYGGFVDGYVRDHPIENLEFVRASVVGVWSAQAGTDLKLVDSLGTIPEAMADVSDRLRLYGEAVPAQAMWRTELALRESGYGGDDLQAALARLDQRLATMSAAANNAPEIVHEAVADVRRSIIEVLDRLDLSTARMAETLHGERMAFAENVTGERKALLEAADTQRRALAKDVSAMAENVVRTAGQETRMLVRQALILIILLSLILLGLPFAAGYALGRARARTVSP